MATMLEREEPATHVRHTGARKTKSGDGRLAFLDWTRGLAAVVMLHGHVYHSFTRPDLRDLGPYVMSQFVGGVAPATFLFLTGITFAFLMESRERKGLLLYERWMSAVKRAGYLFLLAALFRLQLFVFALPQGSWQDLLKVDILNAMGFAMLMFSPLALIDTERRAKYSVLLGLAIAFLAPVVSNTDWSWCPPWLSAYWVPDYNYFSFFPWASFIAFGVGAGSLLRIAPTADRGKLLQWGAIIGVWLMLGARFAADLPYTMYSKSDYWLDSPWLVFAKLAGILLVLAVAYLWAEVRKPGWSWLEQFGTTSLLVYWVHIELVYGRWFGFWKDALSTPQVIACAVAVILLMLGLSVLRTRWKSIWPVVRARLGGGPPAGFYKPERVSGD
jgi:uncharacterized membrane protein